MKILIYLWVLVMLSIRCLPADERDSIGDSPFIEAEWKHERNSVLVSFVNPTSRPIRIWKLGNTWGDGCYSLFYVDRKGSIERRVRRKLDDAYTVNFPQMVEVMAGGRLAIGIDLTEKCWGEAGDVLSKGTVRIRFEFEIDSSPEAVKQGVLIGRMISNWLPPQREDR